jgi:PII-like signaling protein
LGRRAVGASHDRLTDHLSLRRDPPVDTARASARSFLPLLSETVETEEKIRGILPLMDEMVVDRLITLEKVEVIAYRAGQRS